jgi:hypothetical protein
MSQSDLHHHTNNNNNNKKHTNTHTEATADTTTITSQTLQDLTGDGGVRKQILVPGVGDCPKNNNCIITGI